MSEIKTGFGFFLKNTPDLSWGHLKVVKTEKIVGWE